MKKLIYKVMAVAATGLLVQCGNVNALPAQTAHQQDKVFSGPQVGESLPNFELGYGLGDRVGDSFDIVAEASGRPLVVLFVHKRTRPAFGLARAIVRYCQEHSSQEHSSSKTDEDENQSSSPQLLTVLCFLGDDATEIRTWLSNIKRYLPSGARLGVSLEGGEGPGVLGLNRNVEMTVIVAEESTVQANFALVQPSAHADGPEILQAIADVLGVEEKPDINQYLPTNQRAQDAPIAIDPRLRRLFRQILADDASREDVQTAIEKINELVGDNRQLRAQRGELVRRLAARNQLDEFGTAAQRKLVRSWLPDRSRQTNGDQMNDRLTGKLRGLLRRLIQKNASEDDVKAAAKAVEAFVEERPQAGIELGRICRRIVMADRLDQYGTPAAQAVLKRWAKKYGD